MLFVIFTPIGNLADISLRAIDCLNNSDIILCENSNHTKKLLNKYNISKKLLHLQPNSNAETNQAKKIIDLIANQNKKICLVTDAGAPGISDPGMKIIKNCITENIKFQIIPGASAPLIALLGSGFDTNEVYFGAFLPLKKQKKITKIKKAIELGITAIFFESPHRIIKTLEIINDIAPDTQICIARELTKIYEEFIRGKISEILPKIKKRTLKGEITLLIQAKKLN